MTTPLRKIVDEQHHMVSRVDCEICGARVLAKNLYSHQKTLKCKKAQGVLTAKMDNHDQSGKKKVAILDKRAYDTEDEEEEDGEDDLDELFALTEEIHKSVLATAQLCESNSQMLLHIIAMLEEEDDVSEDDASSVDEPKKSKPKRDSPVVNQVVETNEPVEKKDN